ncbi:unnamed protein product [Sphenostylis stenocarpa]|uniref:Uncharacterized protein n=1 Tax=Sphenostylis stenocarpa TaxID=92480 RepID=A0AA86T4Q4_9FABA|nr:unnamed protein product [Sphenostylis stenocarpa]
MLRRKGKKRFGTVRERGRRRRFLESRKGVMIVFVDNDGQRETVGVEDGRERVLSVTGPTHSLVLRLAITYAEASNNVAKMGAIEYKSKGDHQYNHIDIQKILADNQQYIEKNTEMEKIITKLEEEVLQLKELKEKEVTDEKEDDILLRR